MGLIYSAPSSECAASLTYWTPRKSSFYWARDADLRPADCDEKRADFKREH